MKEKMHLSEADIVLFLEKKISRESRVRMELHFADCAACTEQLAAISHLDEAFSDKTAPGLSRETFEKAKHLAGKAAGPFSFLKPWTRPIRYSIAATVVIALGVGYVLLKDEKPSAQFRSPESASPSFVQLPEDGAIISSSERRLSWQSIPKSTAYRVTLYEESGAKFWDDVRKDTTLLIPETVVFGLGKRYLWRVEVLFPDESKFRSHLRVFTYSP